MSFNVYVFAGGGTGGHLYPGLAVASAVRRAEPDAEIIFLTTTRALDRELLARTDYEQITQRVRPFTLHPLRVPAFWLAWRHSVASARQLFRRRPPRAVIGLGGYAAGPGVVAARKMGIRSAILNPDALPGRANRYLSTRTDLVVMQWDASRPHFPARARCEAIGCPIRDAFANRATVSGATMRGVPVGTAVWFGEEATGVREGRMAFDLALSRPVLLVTGASQGAQTINDCIARVWPTFWKAHPEWQLLHLTGKSDETRVRAAYAAARLPRDSTRVLAFTHEMWHALAAADVVISRAGASTLAEVTATGKPSILLPYPFHKDRHQHANAQVLVDAGAALLVDDTRDAAQTGDALLKALERLSSEETRLKLGAAAKRLGRPDAANAVARWMVDGTLA